MSHTKVRPKPARKPPRTKAPGSQAVQVLKVSTSGKVSPFDITVRARASVPVAQPQRINVADLRRDLGLSQEELARVTGYSTRSIAGWESGQQLSASAKQKLTETKRLTQALAQLMPPNHLGGWLRTPNPAFEGQSPIQIIERGESDRLWRMIFQIDANVAS